MLAEQRRRTDSPAGFMQILRNLRGLATPSLADKDHDLVVLHGMQDVLAELPNNRQQQWIVGAVQIEWCREGSNELNTMHVRVGGCSCLRNVNKSMMKQN